jgi:hypothetical protein
MFIVCSSGGYRIIDRENVRDGRPRRCDRHHKMSDLAALPRPAFRRERKIVMGVTASIFAVVHMRLITEEDHDAISRLER